MKPLSDSPFSIIFFVGIGIFVAQPDGVTKKIIIVAGALIALVGRGTGIYFSPTGFLPELIRPKDAARDKQAKKHTEEKKHEPEIGADLEVSVVNVVDPDQLAISALL